MNDADPVRGISPSPDAPTEAGPPRRAMVCCGERWPTHLATCRRRTATASEPDATQDASEALSLARFLWLELAELSEVTGTDTVRLDLSDCYRLKDAAEAIVERLRALLAAGTPQPTRCRLCDGTFTIEQDAQAKREVHDACVEPQPPVGIAPPRPHCDCGLPSCPDCFPNRLRAVVPPPPDTAAAPTTDLVEPMADCDDATYLDAVADEGLALNLTTAEAAARLHRIAAGLRAPAPATDDAPTNTEAVIRHLARRMDLDARDWSSDPRDAWLYGVVCGWGSALEAVAVRHGWTPEAVEAIQRYHAALSASPRATAPAPTKEEPE